MDLYDLPNNKTFLISAKGLIFNNQGQLLLLKTNGDDPYMRSYWKYDIPGGLTDINENVNNALVREIKEECGLIVEVGKLLATNDILFEKFKFKNGNTKDARIFVLGFFCKYQGGDIKLCEEHVEYQWINSDQIDNFDFIPNIKELIEKALINLSAR